MTTAAVQPTIGAPAQAIGKIVGTAIGNNKTVEHCFGRAVGNIVAIAIRNEQQLWRAHQPYATAPHFHTGEHLNLVGKNRAAFGVAVVVGVFKNDDSVAKRKVEPQRPFGIRVVFRYPHSSPSIPCHGNGVLNSGFRGKNTGTKPRRKLHGGNSLGGAHGGSRCPGFRVFKCWKVRCP